VTQPEAGVTYAPKIAKEDGRLDWTQPAEALDRRIRALTPWPGCFFHHGAEVIRVLAAEPTDAQGAPGTVLDAPARAGGDSGPVIACGTGALRLLRLQRAGRAALPAPEFLRGYALPPGGVVG
jgi:methionyl-tRNA formyltransferase